MLTMSTFQQNGRLGNQLFQLQFMLRLAIELGVEFRLPRWKYDKYFSVTGEQCFQPHSFHNQADILTEEKTEKMSMQLWVDCVKMAIDEAEQKGLTGDIDINGYFQCYSYNPFHDKGKGRIPFVFSNELESYCRKHLLPVEPNFEEDICMCVRRGDYVNNKTYATIHPSYYYHNIPAGKRVFIFSDDMDYCRQQFQNIGSEVIFMDGNRDVEDMCLMSMFKNFVIGNSTFHWWGAYMSGSDNVIYPQEYYADGVDIDMTDFWPPEWKMSMFTNDSRFFFDERVAFMIPFKNDSMERVQNLDIVMSYIRNNFGNVEIIVMEDVSEYPTQTRQIQTSNYSTYRRFKDKHFHRTAMLNMIVKQNPDIDIFFNWDTDVLVPPISIVEAVRMLSEEKYDMVYPYDGRFARVDRKHLGKDWMKFDISMIASEKFKGMENGARESVGGAVAYTREAYVKFGGENERFVSYGPEDRERYIRFNTLGKVGRTGGTLYHLNHPILHDSSNKHPCYQANCKEFDRMKFLDKEGMENYVKSFEWKV